jgi:hypothetical protein
VKNSYFGCKRELWTLNRIVAERELYAKYEDEDGMLTFYVTYTVWYDIENVPLSLHTQQITLSEQQDTNLFDTAMQKYKLFITVVIWGFRSSLK